MAMKLHMFVTHVERGLSAQLASVHMKDLNLGRHLTFATNALSLLTIHGLMLERVMYVKMGYLRGSTLIFVRKGVLKEKGLDVISVERSC